jgi:Tfp pilus assembly protein PilV
MTQHVDLPRYYRSDAHDDAVLTGPIQGLPMSIGNGTTAYATPHPSSPLPAQQPPPRYSNGIATAGLVVAVVGAVLSFVPSIGPVAWVLAPVGLVLSVVGLVRSWRARNGRGTSIAGIVLSVVIMIMCILGTAVFTGAVADVAQQSSAVHQVTYQVSTAKGTKIAAIYSQSQNDDLASASVSGTRSPWSANARISGVMGPTLTASLSPDSNHVNRPDTITCTIAEDGVQVAQNSATGDDAMVTCTR